MSNADRDTPPKSVVGQFRLVFSRLFGFLFAAAGVLFLFVFGGCSTIYLLLEGSVKGRDRELFQWGLAGIAVGAIFLTLGVFLWRRRF